MRIPFIDELDEAHTILIAGAGGGFDVFCGLPLYFWLKNAGKTVHLANLSFTDLGFCDGVRPVPSLVKVLPNTGSSANYFPEVYLSQWLSERYGETPVYAIERAGSAPCRPLTSGSSKPINRIRSSWSMAAPTAFCVGTKSGSERRRKTWPAFLPQMPSKVYPENTW